MARFRYCTADVFTDAPFGGNQLAVFPDARGIPEHRLLDVAREFNYSESTFVFPPDDPKHTRRVRIFTPDCEIPFAGHPTVGTAHVLAAIGDVTLTGDSTNIVLEEGVGPVPVRIVSSNGVPTFCELSVAKLPESIGTPPARDALARVLSLEVDDLLDGDWGAEAFSCGLPWLYIALRDIDAVRRARVRTDVWEQVFAGTSPADISVFALGGDRVGSDIHARVFVPSMSIPEDPATGSAAAALGGYLGARFSQADGTRRWRIEQGFEMRRPSILELEVDFANSAVSGVRVGGGTVLVCEGTMEIS